MQLTSEQADTLIAGARAKAKTTGIAVSVAVLDSAGHMKAFSRMDGAWLGSSDVALRKDRTSILFVAETQSIWDICKPDAQAHGLEHTKGGLATFAGGNSTEGAERRSAGSNRRLGRPGRAGLRCCDRRRGFAASLIVQHRFVCI
jgi:uncharacterized protein GlcG (DUF336 family)